MNIFKVLVMALLAGGLLLWIASSLPSFRFGLSAEPPSAQSESPFPAIDDGYVTLSGIVLYDEDREAPVPYIAYDLPNGDTRTKQLIFRNGNGCSPEAGDLPCATGPHTSFPAYPAGTRITVSGTIVADQIFVDSIGS
jgi:hypothetical protein